MSASPQSHPALAGWQSIVKHFVPGWYASVMGTAVIVVVLFVFRATVPLADALQVFFLVLSGIMLVGYSVPWFLRWIMFPDAVRADLHHPVSASFFPTMPISLIVWGIALEKAGPLMLPHETVFAIMQVLWVAGALGIGGFALVLLGIYFSRETLHWEAANLGWLIPPVSALIVPVLGGALATEFAGTPMGTLYLLGSLVYLGIGTMLLIFVMGAVFTRYMFYKLHAAHLAPTIWVGVAPTAILTIIAIKIVEPLVLFFEVSEGTVETVRFLSKVLGVGLWGFAVFWLLLAIYLTLRHHRQEPLPFALSWWAFTFPLGAFAVSSGVLAQAVGVQVIATVGLVALAGLLVIWLTVALRTLRGVLDGSMFKPH